MVGANASARTQSSPVAADSVGYDGCGDHFLMLDCPTADVEALKAEAEARLDEVEQMRQKCGGGWRKRPGKSRLP